MVYLLRNGRETLIDIELFEKHEYRMEPYIEIKSAINVIHYSNFLLDNLDRKFEIMGDFEHLSELRGWLWEVYFMGDDNNVSKFEDVKKEIERMLDEVAKKYNLKIVID